MELTREEKTSIINQHIKSSLVNSFNLQMALVAEEAAPEPNQNTIDSLTNNINIETAKQEALLNEISSLTD
jgi:hypothetical protein